MDPSPKRSAQYRESPLHAKKARVAGDTHVFFEMVTPLGSRRSSHIWLHAMNGMQCSSDLH